MLRVPMCHSTLGSCTDPRSSNIPHQSGTFLQSVGNYTGTSPSSKAVGSLWGVTLGVASSRDLDKSEMTRSHH